MKKIMGKALKVLGICFLIIVVLIIGYVVYDNIEGRRFVAARIEL